MITLGILGASGRMGQHLVRLAQSDYTQIFELTAQASRQEKLEPLLSCQVLIDFSLPEALEAYLDLALDQNKSQLPILVSGTTGYSQSIEKKLDLYSIKNPVLSAFNFSIGINALLHCLNEVSGVLLANGFSAEIHDKHHVHKKDSPSGTAISLKKAIAGEKATIHSLREGEVIGEHRVTFKNAVEEISFDHKVVDRAVFAQGAYQVAQWLYKKHQNGAKGRFYILDYLKDLSR